MDFALILFICVAVTGVIWLLDTLWRLLTKNYIGVGGPSQSKARWIIDYARAFFPILLIVFLLRSFVIEPFRIPSGSMLPTLQNGDFILVNKYRYGLRIPLTNAVAFEIGSPQRGDVMVFQYPHDESVNFIKRVVGLPGDNVIYDNKQLVINGEPIAQQIVDESSLVTPQQRSIPVAVLHENLGEAPHLIQINEEKSTRTDFRMNFTVPPDHYFVLGDNRDYSNDSRFWGFVPDDNIIGQAFLIWFSWDVAGGSGINWNRIAEAIE